MSFEQPPPGAPPPVVAAPAVPAAPAPAEAVSVPAIIMMGFGLISVIGSVLVALGSLMSFLSNEDPGQLVAAVWSTLGIAFNAVIIFGGMRMKSLQTYPLAMACAVFCCLPTCSGFCCVVGLVPGIWSIVVLMRPEVKAAFT
ncbi:MAG: hypothetical protein AB7S26_20750 [Sandaracinaceae bacterium]